MVNERFRNSGYFKGEAEEALHALIAYFCDPFHLVFPPDRICEGLTQDHQRQDSSRGAERARVEEAREQVNQ